MISKLKIKQKPKTSRTKFSLKTFFRDYISAIKCKALFFNYSSLASTTVYNVLTSLEKNNRIAGYMFLEEDQIFRIFLSYDLTQKRALIPQVTYFSSQGRTKSISYKKLQQFQTQNPNAFILIRTPRGILDLKSCLFHKCGGEFLISLT